MKLKKLTSLDKMLSLSILFTMLLLAIRCFYAQQLTYTFYIWNTFLAVLPFLFSRALVKMKAWNGKALVLLTCWLAFFPNAAYIVTDLFHYTDRPPVPQWFDLLLVTTAAWNGLLLGILSLMQVEQYLARHLQQRRVHLLVLISCLLCGYGVYIGRYLRFNSWHVFTHPGSLLYAVGSHVIKPHQHAGVWAFTVLFGSMFALTYFTLKQLGNRSLPAV